MDVKETGRTDNNVNHVVKVKLIGSEITRNDVIVPIKMFKLLVTLKLEMLIENTQGLCLFIFTENSISNYVIYLTRLIYIIA